MADNRPVIEAARKVTFCDVLFYLNDYLRFVYQGIYKNYLKKLDIIAMREIAILRLTRNICFFQKSVHKGFSPIHQVYFY